MKNLRQVFLGIIIALASLGFILGGFSLSMAEGDIASNQTPTHTLTQALSPTSQPFTPSPITPTPSRTLSPSPSSTLTPMLSFTPTLTWTPSLSPSPTNCPLPAGWSPYIVRSGDTLDKIAALYRISGSELQQANCLPTAGLLPGVIIYVPPLPTRTPVPCGRPYTWVVYIVQPGDTLYRLSVAYGISVTELQRANCMGSSTLLHTGQVLYVPPWAPLISPPTVPYLTTPTPTLTNTPIIGLPSDTPLPPTDTPVTPTDTPLLPTDTPVTPTETPVPTEMPTTP